MSFANYKKIIQVSFFAFFLAFGMTLSVCAETSFEIQLSGPGAGTSSAASGFGALVVNEALNTGYLRLRLTPLSSSINLNYGVKIVDENDAFLGHVDMINEFVSSQNEYAVGGSLLAKFKQGKIRLVVTTANYPNGEIAGAFKPFSAFVGRISGSYYQSGGEPAAEGFAAVLTDPNGMPPLVYYRLSGLSGNGNLVLLDGTVLDSNAPASTVKLIFVDPTTLSPTFYERLRKGTIALTTSGSGGARTRGHLKPVNKDIDFNGDSRADMAVFRPSNGTWYWLNSSGGFPGSLKFGQNGDVPVPADYDGDGITDFAVWRPSNGVFYISNGNTGAFSAILWGKNGDTPLAADFDGDGKSDTAVFRPGANNTQSTFWVYKSTGGYFAVPFGLGDDKPLVADFDGDRTTDITVWRPSDGTFYSINSSDGSFRFQKWGLASDKPLARDFDGDGKSDYLAYRNVLNLRTWYILTSSSGFASYTDTLWGNPFAEIQAADFTGDGMADYANYQSGIWTYRDSQDGEFKTVNIGLSTDIPLHGK